MQATVFPVLASDLASIKARGYLVVAVREGWRPLSFRDSTGALKGLEVDLAHELARLIFNDPNALSLKVVTNQDRLVTLLEDQADLAIAGLTITPARRRLVSFSGPYYLDGAGFLLQGSKVRQLGDLQRGSIGVLQGSSTLAVVRYRLPHSQLVPLATYAAGLIALDQGKIDALAADITVLTGIQQEQASYRLLPDRMAAEPLAIAMAKGSSLGSLQTLIDQAIGDWHQSGWLQQRIRFWGLPDVADQPGSRPSTP
ncbi:MAG: transporter substrate-binding domain-containing protein [Cyanobacteria bacterium REEB459]|nr:transporter substrate-binding domain-containing protein [Cyanobacteria bacterium REEB459]